jgi:hypothetical protein
MEEKMAILTPITAIYAEIFIPESWSEHFGKY